MTSARFKKKKQKKKNSQEICRLLELPGKKSNFWFVFFFFGRGKAEFLEKLIMRKKKLGKFSKWSR